MAIFCLSLSYTVNGGSNIPEGMLPMCYPADHTDDTSIPQWATIRGKRIMPIGEH